MWIEDKTGFTWKMSEEEKWRTHHRAYSTAFPRKTWDGPIYQFRKRTAMNERKMTVDELEKLLNSEDNTPVQILPDGQVVPMDLPPNTRTSMNKLRTNTWSTPMDANLSPSTLTNADGTPYVAESIHANGRILLVPESDEVVRAIVREELTSMKAGLAKEVLAKLQTEIRLQAGMISPNEARKERGY